MDYTTSPSKYYLGDAGYALTKNCLTPFRGTRYHLKEWKDSHHTPSNMKELFNLRHSTLRNVIERTFGVIKKRFNILNKIDTSYSLKTQISLVYCCFMLHNCIRKNNLITDQIDDEVVDDEVNKAALNAAADEAEVEDDRDPELNTWRLGIATAMWNEYQQYLTENN